MKSGFTLFEVAIVTVIIGLVLGGIFIGNDMIQQAEIRSALQQVERLDAAFNTFRTKYNCLPGDCKNAAEKGFSASPLGSVASIEAPEPAIFALFHLFSPAWAGVVVVAPPAGTDPVSLSLANGNGNSRVESDAEYYNSLYQLWQAGLITDLNQSTGNILLSMKATSTTGTQAFWNVRYLSPIANSLVPAENHYYWATSTMDAGGAGAGVIPPDKAYRMDAKKDDGLPEKGDIRATGRNTNPTPATSGPVFDSGVDAGAAGATNPYCVTSDSPNLYNVQNRAETTVVGARCTVTIKANI
jgi:prepilin-type N-terminal cleavage/methylation domain-containing protein